MRNMPRCAQCRKSLVSYAAQYRCWRSDESTKCQLSSCDHASTLNRAIRGYSNHGSGPSAHHWKVERYRESERTDSEGLGEPCTVFPQRLRCNTFRCYRILRSAIRDWILSAGESGPDRVLECTVGLIRRRRFALQMEAYNGAKKPRGSGTMPLLH